jgi:hypothetical protein
MTRIGADFFATNFHEFSRMMDIEDWSGFYRTLVAGEECPLGYYVY